MKHSNAHRQGIATVKASGESGGKTHYDVDVTVIGSGPAGLSVVSEKILCFSKMKGRGFLYSNLSLIRFFHYAGLLTLIYSLPY